MGIKNIAVVGFCISVSTGFALSIEEIESIARSGEPSVEGFLASLKKNQPELSGELSKNFTLMKATGSTQDATCKNPRVITYSQTANVIMTFNGSKDAYHNGEGTESVEMMLFDDKTKKFQLVDVNMAAKPPKITKNPADCMTCHSDKAGNVMPLWNQFPNWHNAYGDFINILSKEEQKSLNEFKSRAKNDPRYSFLDFNSSNPNFPYDVPTGTGGADGNVALTQRLNSLYTEFLHGRADEAYADEAGLLLSLKRALVIEDVCKPMLQMFVEDQKSGPSSKKSKKSPVVTALFANLTELFDKTDALVPGLLKQMRPPLDSSEAAQVVSEKVSQRQLLFRAITGLGMKGRGLATLRPASKKAPKARGEEDSCYTDSQAEVAAARKQANGGRSSEMGGLSPAEQNLNPLFLMTLPDQVLGNDEALDSVGPEECQRIARLQLDQAAAQGEKSEVH